MIGIGAGVLVVVLLLVILLGNKEQLSWDEEYKYNQDQPYDNFLIYSLLEARAEKDSFITIKKSVAKELKPSSIEGTASYVYISDYMMHTDDEIDSLLLFAENGHDVFISSNNFSNDFAGRLESLGCIDSTEYEWEYDEDYDTSYIVYDYGMLHLMGSFYDSTAKLNLTHPSLMFDEALQYVYKIDYKPAKYNWQYFDTNKWCGTDEKVAKLGSNYTKVNFIKVKYGEGAFYLHTTPLAFTNYFLLNEDKLAYAQSVFSHLPDGTIYWDEGSRYYHSDSKSNYKSKPFGKSELKYILSQPASKWAFYTMLTGIFLYIVFYMKRRQRIIPVIEPYPNTSVEYVQTVGGLYFMKSDHRRLAEQKFKLFLSFIRNRYRLSTSTLDSKLVKQLASISKVEEARVNEIFELYGTIADKSAMSEEQLISFNKYLEYFYQNCK